MTPMMSFFVALGLTSAACYVMMIRADRRRVRRPSSGSDGGADSSGASGGDGFSFASWFGNTASTDVMGNPIDGGGFDGEATALAVAATEMPRVHMSFCSVSFADARQSERATWLPAATLICDKVHFLELF